MSKMNDKILIVDDDIEILTMLNSILSEEGYTVYRAESGEQALDVFQAQPVDLVITDMSMPGIGGLEVLHRIKQLDPNIEVIILTGHATFENAVKALREDGAFNYLTKPLENIEDLIITVKRAIEKSKLRLENKNLIEELKREVEERKKIDQALLRSKTNLQSVFDGISEPLIMLDHKMTVKVLNLAARDYAQAKNYMDIVGNQCFIALAGKSAPCPGCKLQKALQAGNPMLFERKGLIDPSRIEEVVIYPMHKNIEEEEHAIIRIRDITEEKKIEGQLIRADRLSSLGQLSAGIAHEIRNPLASISLFTGILCDENKYCRSDQEFELFDEIKSSIHRIEDIIKRVLNFAKPSVTSSEQIDLNDLTRESVKLWSSKLRKSQINIDLALDSGLPTVRGDLIGLQQVINNLILNAIEAMGKNGNIKVITAQGPSTLGKPTQSVFLRVHDTGPGIKKANQEDIFNPFFTTKADGTGLGLSISHQIVKRHGGIFSFENNEDAGTTFSMELPVGNLETESSTFIAYESRGLEN